MSLSYLFEGQYELAEEYARKYYDATEGRGNGAVTLIICLAAAGKQEQAEQLYQLIIETQSASMIPAVIHVKANAYFGRYDPAFEYFDKALEEKDSWLAVTLKYSPEWDLLRPDPRLEKVLARLNFPI